MDNRKFPEHYPEKDGEAFPVFIPRGVRDIILDYFNNDINPKSENKKNVFKQSQYEQFTIFGKNLRYFIDCARLEIAANDILLGEEIGIQKTIHLIQKNPLLLRIPVKGTDHLKRTVFGTLLQIAAMAGDVNPEQTIHDEKKRGVVERLQSAGQLSNEEVSDQLAVITSDEAKKANEKRNQLVIQATDKFTTALLQVQFYPQEDFKYFKIRCTPIVTQFEKDLQYINSETITNGYIFYPEIISIVAKNFESHISDFRGRFSFYSGVFWISGFGMLQKYLSIRDTDFVKKGMIRYIKKHEVPARKTDKRDLSKLGYDYFIDYEGDLFAVNCEFAVPENTQDMQVFSVLVENKNKSIEKFTQNTNQRSLLKKLFFWIT